MQRYAYYFICVCAAFVVKGIAGFGDPLIFTPALTAVLPSAIVTPAMAPVNLVMNSRMVWKNRRYFSKDIILPIAAFVLLGIIPGTMLLKYSPPQGLKLVLGLLIIGLGIEMLTRKPDTTHKPNIYIRSIVSFFSGLTAGLFGINLLFLAYMERVTVNREQFRVNACCVFFLENLFRIILMLCGRMYTSQCLLLTLTALPAAFLGMALGARLDKKFSDKMSRRVIIYVFILGGVSATVYALVEML